MELFLSRLVTLQTKIQYASAVRSACDRLRLRQPFSGTHRFFSGEVTGLAVQLPRWKYPVVCEVTTGQVYYENYGGRWGEKNRLHQFLQACIVEQFHLQARRLGCLAAEHYWPGGLIELRIMVSAKKLPRIEIAVLPNGETQLEFKGAGNQDGD